MTDITPDAIGKPQRRHGAGKGEYRFYFAVIFLLSLPTTLLVWALSLLRLARRPEHGPVKTAWSQAMIVTPKIFWA